MQFQTVKAEGREFVLCGSMLIEKEIFDDVRAHAPRGHNVRSWENEQFKRQDYRRLREEGYYTESVYWLAETQRSGRRSYALMVLKDGSGVRRAAGFGALAQ